MEEIIKNILNESIKLKKIFFEQEIDKIIKVVNLIKTALNNDNKVILFGNGGSAADAQHITAELVGKFKKERKGLPGIALTTNSSILTSIANDYSYDVIFAKQVEALVKKGDIVIGISTSGKSKNVIEGIKTAQKYEAITIGFTGNTGGELSKIVDISFIVPSKNTPRIQEIHIMLGHIICELVEK